MGQTRWSRIISLRSSSFCTLFICINSWQGTNHFYIVTIFLGFTPRLHNHTPLPNSCCQGRHCLTALKTFWDEEPSASFSYLLLPARTRVCTQGFWVHLPSCCLLTPQTKGSQSLGPEDSIYCWSWGCIVTAYMSFSSPGPQVPQVQEACFINCVYP